MTSDLRHHRRGEFRVVSKERARGGRAVESEADECDIIRRYPLMYLATALAAIALFLLFLAASPSAA